MTLDAAAFLGGLATLLAQTTAPAPDSTGGGDIMSMMLIWLLFIGGFWFLLIAPQRKQQKEQEAMIKATAAGDEVMTAGGIFGKVVSVKEDRVTLKLEDGARMEVAKAYLQRNMTADEKRLAEAKSKADAKAKK